MRRQANWGLGQFMGDARADLEEAKQIMMKKGFSELEARILVSQDQDTLNAFFLASKPDQAEFLAQRKMDPLYAMTESQYAQYVASQREMSRELAKPISARSAAPKSNVLLWVAALGVGGYFLMRGDK